MDQSATRMISLKEAAELTGKSKATISRAVTSGRMSAQKNEAGALQIDPSELFRVFEAKQNATVQRTENIDATDELKRQNEKLETELASMKRLLDEMVQARDDWKRQAQTLANILPKPEQSHRSLLKRLFG